MLCRRHVLAAVPEIRAQAAQLAEHLLHVLTRRPNPGRVGSTAEEKASSRKYLRV